MREEVEEVQLAVPHITTLLVLEEIPQQFQKKVVAGTVEPRHLVLLLVRMELKILAVEAVVWEI